MGEAPDLDGLEGAGRDLRIAEQVCPGCPALAACWERRYPRARRMVADLWRAALGGSVTWQAVGGPDTIFCLRPREMADAANRQAALYRDRQEMLRILAANRRASVAPLVALGRHVSQLAEVAATAEATAAQTGAPAPRPAPLVERWVAPPAAGRWGYACTAVRQARPGRAVSGDSLRCRPLAGDRLALACSDGMGSGEPAAVASAGAVEHLLAALAAGRAGRDALEQMNGELQADGGAERFATMDLVIVHLRGGTLEWHKMGAPAGYLLGGAGLRVLPGGGLPAGILASPEIRSGRARLRPGDVLVLASDGLGDPAAAPPSGNRRRVAARPVWVRRMAEPGARAEAEALRAVRERAALGDHDDLSVLVCVFAVPVSPAGGRRPAGGERADAYPAAAGPARRP